MTWSKLDDRFGDDPVMLTLSRSHRLVWVEALSWCSRQQTDGAIPRAALRRITDDDDPNIAADALVAAKLWSVTASGWQMVDYERLQTTKREIDCAKIESVWRAERVKMHRKGDHALCVRGSSACRAGILEWDEWRDLVEACAVANATPAQLRSLDTDLDVDKTRRDKVESKSKSKSGTTSPPRWGSAGRPSLGSQEALGFTTAIVDNTKPTKTRTPS